MKFYMAPAPFIQLVKKYAIIIFIFSFIHVFLIFTLPVLQELIETQSAQFQLVLSWVPAYLLNIVMSIIVYSDMKKSGTVSVSVILTILAVGEIGVAIFLLIELYHMFGTREPTSPPHVD